MKKMTATVAKELSKLSGTTITRFSDAIAIIHLHTILGMTNCFIDGKLNDLKVVKAELEERGFRCHIEQVGGFFGTPPEGPKFLSVEW